jgi:hypothetical protein
MCSGYVKQLIPFKETTSAPSNEPECFRVHHGMTSKQDAGRLIHLSIFMYSSYYKNVVYWPCILNLYITIHISSAVTLRNSEFCHTLTQYLFMFVVWILK